VCNNSGGCKAQVPKPYRIARNIRGSKLTLRASSELSAQIPGFLAGTFWNEPDNTNEGSYAEKEPKDKVDLVAALLPQVFDWARSVHPIQPLTSGVWKDKWSSPDKLDKVEKIQMEMSDVLSFHNYGKPEEFHPPSTRRFASTGRLSTTNPNLQAIPIRTELGKEIRSAFVS